MPYLADSIPLLLPEEGILWIDQTLQAQDLTTLSLPVGLHRHCQWRQF
ncbi:MAG TPA: hypothetical protein VN666_07695 [Nitrospira sp.]|nr:hypothetical protein [Nitrospira sp.]